MAQDKKALKRTVLYDTHLQLGAKMVPFAGWEMPVQYTGILAEHRTVRSAAGLFDVSHMGEIWIEGERALESLQELITNDAGKLRRNQVMYSPMCKEDGGTVDDLLVYKISERRYLLVVNAGNREKDLAWIKEHVGKKASVEDRSDETAQLALQGPASQKILQRLTGAKLDNLKYYWFIEEKINGIEGIISRTGYTGEDGFEIYVEGERAPELWNVLLEAGKDAGLNPVGLGARDTLRFEACLPLYGHELSEEITPLEAGLKAFVKLDKENFVGKNALLEEYNLGLAKCLVGFEMMERGIPRSGYPIYDEDGEKQGFVSSGSFAPHLQKNLGLGFVGRTNIGLGVEITIGVRGKLLKARIVKTPFYKKVGKRLSAG